MTNKKAQIGRGGLALVATLIAVIVLMAIFVALAGGISLIKAPPEHEIKASLQSQENNILLKKITLKVDEEKETELLLIDAKALQLDNRIKIEDFDSALQQFLNEENNCLIFYDSTYEGTNSVKGHKFNELRPIEIYNIEPYRNLLLSTNIQANGFEREIKHYYGKC